CGAGAAGTAAGFADAQARASRRATERLFMAAQVSGAPAAMLPAALEHLHGALVLHRRRARAEGAEVAAPAGLGILLARVEAVVAAPEFAEHGPQEQHSDFQLHRPRKPLADQLSNLGEQLRARLRVAPGRSRRAPA